jgi:beta-glucosidase/6-phospho-beta-glucosidase/beta-galactosidase
MRFMFATGIESSYPQIQNGKWRLDQMEATGHYKNWREDLQLVKDLKTTHLRYGPPLHRVFLGPGSYDWSFVDGVFVELQRLEITPIVDLCHFGLPDWLQNFQNPEFPHFLAEYASAFAARFPWVQLYTPINEMYVTARESALRGSWNEALRSERAFVTATANLAEASIRMIEAVRERRSDAVFVTSESSEFFQACCPDEEVRKKADFENQRKTIALDLLYGVEPRDDIRQYLEENGLDKERYAWFKETRVTERTILGVDYYDWNEVLIDRDGNVQSLGELFGWFVIAMDYYERYKRPLMHTETNCPDAKEAPGWLWKQWHNVELIRSRGVPTVGFTWYSLHDQVDWDRGIAEPNGNIYPVGLYDLNRNPRISAEAYRQLIDMFAPCMEPTELDFEAEVASRGYVA